jgi:hypothetical protein
LQGWKLQVSTEVGQSIAGEMRMHAMNKVLCADQRRTNLARKPTRLDAWGRKGVLKSASRRRLSLGIRRAIRARAGDKCEDCGRPIKAVIDTEYPEQWTDREVLDIYHDYPCHRCGFRFPVVAAG